MKSKPDQELCLALVYQFVVWYQPGSFSAHGNSIYDSYLAIIKLKADFNPIACHIDHIYEGMIERLDFIRTPEGLLNGLLTGFVPGPTNNPNDPHGRILEYMAYRELYP